VLLLSSALAQPCTHTSCDHTTKRVSADLRGRHITRYFIFIMTWAYTASASLIKRADSSHTLGCPSPLQDLEHGLIAGYESDLGSRIKSISHRCDHRLDFPYCRAACNSDVRPGVPPVHLKFISECRWHRNRWRTVPCRCGRCAPPPHRCMYTVIDFDRSRLMILASRDLVASLFR
jgi:hypothetical protein